MLRRTPHSPSQASRLLPLALPLVALLAVFPLLRDGPSCGHDFDFHLLSWFEAARQFAHGDLHPHWAGLPAFGAGEPRFVFYPPLSWTLGALLTLALTHLPYVPAASGFTAVPILFTWMALSAAGLALYTLARRYVPPAGALLAATLYLSNPYVLFTAYERTAFAELLAAAILPFLLAAVLPRVGSDGAVEMPSIPGIAVPMALLWLTNAPAAVIGSYALALIAVLRLVALRKVPRSALALVLRAAAGAALGLALAGFYLVPALYEQRWVEIAMAVLPGMRPVDNTLFHHTADADHDAVLRTASLVAVTLLGATAAVLAAAFRQVRGVSGPAFGRATLRTLALLAATIAFLLTPVSLPLWRHVPELAFLQFPWRLLAILGVVLALAAAFAMRDLRLRPALAVAAAALLAGCVAAPSATHFHQGCDVGEAPREALPTLATNYTVLPTDEYTPQPADNDALRQNNPPFRVASDPDEPTPGSARPGPAPQHVDLALTAPGFVILNLRDYPAWRAMLNGRAIAHGPQRDDGLLTLALPAGHNHLDLVYAHTADQTAGDLVSLLALLTLGGLWAYRRSA